jgi:hypothetical protein
MIGRKNPKKSKLGISKKIEKYKRGPAADLKVIFRDQNSLSNFS